MLNAGADPNAKNVVGETPLVKAVSCRHCAVISGLTSSSNTDVHIEVCTYKSVSVMCVFPYAFQNVHMDMCFI